MLEKCLSRVEASLKRLEPSLGAPCMLLRAAKNYDLAMYILKNHSLKAQASTALFEGDLCVLETVVELC